MIIPGNRVNTIYWAVSFEEASWENILVDLSLSQSKEKQKQGKYISGYRNAKFN